MGPKKESQSGAKLIFAFWGGRKPGGLFLQIRKYSLSLSAQVQLGNRLRLKAWR
jgi:hypothetical protein